MLGLTFKIGIIINVMVHVLGSGLVFELGLGSVRVRIFQR